MNTKILMIMMVSMYVFLAACSTPECEFTEANCTVSGEDCFPTAPCECPACNCPPEKVCPDVNCNLCPEAKPTVVYIPASDCEVCPNLTDLR